MAKPMRQLTNINAVIQKGIAAAVEIFEQLDHPVEKDDGEVTSEIKGSIQFSNVAFGYNQQESVLKDISFTVEPGKTIALVGKSGSGKSTISSLISRFYSGFSGKITIDDIDIKDYKLQHLRNSISIVTQKPNLFNDTVERNIAYGYEDIDKERLVFAAEKAGCKDFIDRLPDGFRTYIGDDGVLLSGGQRQRLAIARAFYKNSPIVILDEATSALDTESESFIQESIDELTHGKTTIIIAHRLSTIEKPIGFL
jgi:subfamily B ATP-binding cassette protein MsbA